MTDEQIMRKIRAAIETAMEDLGNELDPILAPNQDDDTRNEQTLRLVALMVYALQQEASEYADIVRSVMAPYANQTIQ